MNFLHEDCRLLFSQMKLQEKEFILKRRWLMGLPASRHERKNPKEPKFLKCRSVPETLTREDDVFFEDIKKFVEKGFGVYNSGAGTRVSVNDMKFFQRSDNIIKSLLPFLDELTNKGLHKFAMILTGGSSKLEKTRKKMKKLIRECLLKPSRSQHGNQLQPGLLPQLSKFLMDKKHFRRNSVTFHRASAHFYSPGSVTKVLDGLEDMPSVALSAMHRKLRGISGFIPHFFPPRSGWNRDRLAKQVRNTILKMLSELGEGDELPDPLANSLAVAQLSTELAMGNRNPKIDFYQSSPGIMALQGDIIKVILLLKTRIVKASELRDFQLVLAPDAEVSDRSLRSTVRRILTEYLFECGDLVSIPKSLIEALNVINKHSDSPGLFGISDKEIDEEVELLLGISAQMKQILWDLLLDCGLDEDYADGYVEDLVESEISDGFDDDDDQQPEFFDSGTSGIRSISNEQCESVDESNPVDNEKVIYENQSQQLVVLDSRIANSNLISSSPVGMMNSCLIDDEAARSDPTGRPISDIFEHTREEENVMPEIKNTHRNKYLALQELCDGTSVLVYALVGQALEMFAGEECLNLSLPAESYLRVPKEGQTRKYATAVDLVTSFPKRGDCFFFLRCLVISKQNSYFGIRLRWTK